MYLSIYVSYLYLSIDLLGGFDFAHHGNWLSRLYKAVDFASSAAAWCLQGREGEKEAGCKLPPTDKLMGDKLGQAGTPEHELGPTRTEWNCLQPWWCGRPGGGAGTLSRRAKTQLTQELEKLKRLWGKAMELPARLLPQTKEVSQLERSSVCELQSSCCFSPAL